MRILGIAGSLRRASYNRALLEAAREVCPNSMRLDVFDLDDIPLYNADWDVDGPRRLAGSAARAASNSSSWF